MTWDLHLLKRLEFFDVSLNSLMSDGASSFRFYYLQPFKSFGATTYPWCLSTAFTFLAILHMRSLSRTFSVNDLSG